MNRIYSAINFALLALVLMAFQSCDDDFKVEYKTFSKNQCVRADQCVDYQVVYPVFIGDTSSISPLLAGIRQYLLELGGVPLELPLDAGLEQGSKGYIQSFVIAMQSDSRPNIWSLQVIGTLPLINEKVINCDFKLNAKTPENSTYTSTRINSYDRAAGKFLTLQDIVMDPESIRADVEKGFRKAQDLPENYDLAQILSFLHGGKLPMSPNITVTPEGLRFFYNWYEYANRPMPVADFTLSWEQLGARADKSRWF